jgi:hypothetical protein
MSSERRYAVVGFPLLLAVAIVAGVVPDARAQARPESTAVPPLRVDPRPRIDPPPLGAGTVDESGHRGSFGDPSSPPPPAFQRIEGIRLPEASKPASAQDSSSRKAEAPASQKTEVPAGQKPVIPASKEMLGAPQSESREPAPNRAEQNPIKDVDQREAPARETPSTTGAVPRSD